MLSIYIQLTRFSVQKTLTVLWLGLAPAALGQQELTVDLLRQIGDARGYPDRWSHYMGLDSGTKSAGSRAGSIDLLQDIARQTSASAVANLKDEVAALAASGADPVGRASGLYAYYNRIEDVSGQLRPVEDFEQTALRWPDLEGFLPKFIQHYTYTDLAWQARAEGNADRAAQYFARVADTAEKLFAEYPNDPNQIWVVYDYLFACGALGVERVETAVARMKDIIATQPPSVLRWAARYQVGLFSTLYPSIPPEGKQQYEAMLEESQLPFFATALASPDIARDSAGMLQLMKGHALLGVGRYSDAEEQYAYIVKEYADRYAWAPRTSGRTIVDASRYGVQNSAAYSLALCRAVLNAADPEASQKNLLDFISAYPKSEYAPAAIRDLANLCEVEGKYDEAIVYHQRLIAEFPNSSLVEDARSRMESAEQRLVTK